MLSILMHMLLGSPFGPYVLAWGFALLTIAAVARFRWAVLFAAISVAIVAIGSIGFLTLYDGVQDASGDFVIEGPEFFGVVFIVVSSCFFAASALLVAAGVAWLRHLVVMRPALPHGID
jgi:hypothetical protein